MKNENEKGLIVSKETVITKIVKFIKSIFTNNRKIEQKNESNQESEDLKKLEEKNLKKKNISVIKENKQEGPKAEFLNDSDYYKMIYKEMNEGNLSVQDLTPSEFLSVMKMQKVEYEIVTKKLKNAMDNLEEG